MVPEEVRFRCCPVLSRADVSLACTGPYSADSSRRVWKGTGRPGAQTGHSQCSTGAAGKSTSCCARRHPLRSYARYTPTANQRRLSTARPSLPLLWIRISSLRLRALPLSRGSRGRLPGVLGRGTRRPRRGPSCSQREAARICVADLCKYLYLRDFPPSPATWGPSAPSRPLSPLDKTGKR